MKRKKSEYSLKSTDGAKFSLYKKLYGLEAFTEITAISVDKLELTKDEDIAFDESVLEEEIIVYQIEEKEFCYLAKHYRPPGSSKTTIRRATLFPIIICLVMMILAVVGIIYQIFRIYSKTI